MKQLEDEIARLEMERLGLGSSTALSSSTASSAVAIESDVDGASVLAPLLQAFLPRAGTLHHHERQIRLGLTPSRTKEATVSTQVETESPPRGPGAIAAAGSAGDYMDIGKLSDNNELLRRMLVDLAHSLVDKYWEKSLSVWQVLDRESVDEKMNLVFATHQLPLDEQISETPGGLVHDCFVVHLILAVAVTIDSWKGGHHARRLALSTELFYQGLRYFSHPDRTLASEISELQAMFLLLQYAMVNPRCANVVILSGRVMRICSELGLHRKIVHRQALLRSFHGDLRERLFWAVYVLDRMVCSTLQRPVSIPDAAIDVSLPSKELNCFRHIICFHQILSHMMEVHLTSSSCSTAVGNDGLAHWLHTTEEKLWDWYNHDRTSHTEMTEFRLHYGLTVLHRPSLRNRNPSEQSMLIAFNSACNAAYHMSSHLSHGSVRLCWAAAHYTFETAIVALFCLRKCAARILEDVGGGLERTLHRTKSFTANLLAIADQGWPEALRLARTYEGLINPLLDSLFDACGRGLAVNEGNLELSSEVEDAVAKFLFPGAARVEPLEFQGPLQDNNDCMYDLFASDMDNFWSQFAEQVI